MVAKGFAREGARVSHGVAAREKSAGGVHREEEPAVELGVAVPGLSERSLMMLSHVAMIGGMAALMICRWDRYAHGTHGRRAEHSYHDNQAPSG